MHFEGPTIFESILLNCKRHSILKLLCILGLWFPISVYAEVVVITHPDTPLISVTIEQLRERWLVNTNLLGSVRVDIFDIAEGNPLRHEFYEKFFYMSDRQLKAYWAKKVFMEEGFPPGALKSEEEMINWVMGAPNRVGYVKRENLKKPIKIIFSEKALFGETNGKN